MASTDTVHENITGGCLCGKVRYTIKFPTADSWPPQSYDVFSDLMLPQSHTCQCTQCRKQTGSLIAPLITVNPTNISWSTLDVAHTSRSPPELREFASSPHGRRGFCASCGSSISWRHEETPQEIELFLGSVDEKWLIGDRTERVSSEELAKDGAWDELVKKEGYVGRDLCEPHGNYFFRNAVRGITDTKIGSGTTWVEDTAKGLVIPD